MTRCQHPQEPSYSSRPQLAGQQAQIALRNEAEVRSEPPAPCTLIRLQAGLEKALSIASLIRGIVGART